MVTTTQDETDDEYIARTRTDYRRCQMAAINIENGFKWSETKEGFDYWLEVCTRLRDLTRAGRELQNKIDLKGVGEVE